MRLVAVLLVGGALTLAAQQGPVPVEDEPNHKTVVQNDYIRAYRVTLEPGQSTQVHRHSHDDVGVQLADSRITQDEPGKAKGQPTEMKTGQVGARTITGHSLIHRVNNVGKTTFDVMDVEVLKRPEGEETKPIADVAAENPSERVYRWELRPGETSAEHTHERPYLIVAATDMELKMSSPDGQAMTHGIKKGDSHWIDTKVTHRLSNAGSEPGVLVEVELK